jgi:C4-type Zn-finger protein
MSFRRSSDRVALTCPLCENTTFRREESRQDSRWGFSSHRMTLMVCERCRYVLHFYDEHSIFDFD